MSDDAVFGMGQKIILENSTIQTKERITSIDYCSVRIRYDKYEAPSEAEYDAFYFTTSLEQDAGYIFSLEVKIGNTAKNYSIYLGHIENKDSGIMEAKQMQWICDYTSSGNGIKVIKAGVNLKLSNANCLLIKHENNNKFGGIRVREFSKILPLNKDEKYERIGARVEKLNGESFSFDPPLFIPHIMVNNELIPLYSSDNHIFYETSGNVKINSIGIAYFDKNKTNDDNFSGNKYQVIKTAPQDQDINKFNCYIDYLYRIA